jgi:hypothetical protein
MNMPAYSELRKAATAKRVDALFHAMATDVLLREQFVTDPSQVAWKANPPRPRPRSAPIPQMSPEPPHLPLLRPLLRNLSERGIERIRSNFPGWDVYTLKAEFDIWIGEDPAREPKDYEAAFYGFVKQHHYRNQHQLRR